MNRTELVMKELNVTKADALKIVEHLRKHDCLDWIDDFDEDGRSREPLVDVHWEDNFKDMINWQYEDVQPFEMLGKSKDINDYPEMLKLENVVIFWYAMVV